MNQSLEQKLACEPRLLTGNDLQALRHHLGISLHDLYFLSAWTARRVNLSVEQGDDRVENVTLSLLTRLLTAYREASPIPTPPEMQEAYDRINALVRKGHGQFTSDRSGPDLPWRRLSMMMGLGAWAGNSWSKDDDPSPRPIVARLLVALLKAIELHDGEALEMYRKILDAEAKARGFTGGFEDVVRANGWTASARETIIPAAKTTTKSVEKTDI